MLEVVSAGGLVIHDSSMLLVRHTGAKDDQKLGFAKGHVELGETVEDAARREFFEETRRRGKIIGYLGSVAYDSVEYDRNDLPVGPSRKTVEMFLMGFTPETDQKYEGRTTPVWCKIGAVIAGTDPEMQMRHPEDLAFLTEIVLPLVGIAPGEGPIVTA